MAIIEFGEPRTNTIAWVFFFVGGGLGLTAAIANLYLLRTINRSARVVMAGRSFVAISAFAFALYGTVEVIKLGRENTLTLDQVAIYCGGAMLWFLIACVELEERWDYVRKHVRARSARQLKRRRASNTGHAESSMPPRTADDPPIS